MTVVGAAGAGSNEVGPSGSRNGQVTGLPATRTVYVPAGNARVSAPTYPVPDVHDRTLAPVGPVTEHRDPAGRTRNATVDPVDACAMVTAVAAATGPVAAAAGPAAMAVATDAVPVTPAPSTTRLVTARPVTVRPVTVGPVAVGPVAVGPVPHRRGAPGNDSGAACRGCSCCLVTHTE